MRKSADTDKQCIEKILNHIMETKDCFTDFDINSHTDLKQSKYCVPHVKDKFLISMP